MNKLAQQIGTDFAGGSRLTDQKYISNYVSAIVAGAISLAGVAMLFLLIFGGIGIISGAGKNDPQKLEQGKKAATSALIGFIVVLSAYWIVKLIEQITGLVLI